MNNTLNRVMALCKFDETMLKKLQRLGCCTPKDAPVGEHEYSEICACELEDLAHDNYARLLPIIKAQGECIAILAEALEQYHDGENTPASHDALLVAEAKLKGLVSK